MESHVSKASKAANNNRLHPNLSNVLRALSPRLLPKRHAHSHAQNATKQQQPLEFKYPDNVVEDPKSLVRMSHGDSFEEAFDIFSDEGEEVAIQRGGVMRMSLRAWQQPRRRADSLLRSARRPRSVTRDQRSFSASSFADVS